MAAVPTSRYLSRSWGLLLATLPFVGGIIWGAHHIASVAQYATGRGNPLAVAWAAGFFVLWWNFVAWLEKPHTVSPRQAAQLARLRVTVSVPAFNEEPHLLRQCLESLLAQDRLPDRIRVVDDGSDLDYREVRDWFVLEAAGLGIQATWTRTHNRGKRHAQMEALAHDDGDIFMTLDSDTILDRRALSEGVKPFADPRVHSVAGMVVVWNMRDNWLSFLTCMLYTPFTRGFRSAQGVMGRVMVNSGTLAFYRGATIRKYAGSYENEQFLGRPMQMNDDSMMTFYALMENDRRGRAVHQPTSVAYTIVPTKVPQYLKQQLRWMRGNLVRQLWWARYLRVTDPAWWMPLSEQIAFLLSVATIATAAIRPDIIPNPHLFLVHGLLIAVLVNYVVALRYFVIRRSDEPLWLAMLVWLSAPLAGFWRLGLRVMMLYAMCTFWKVGSWGTRAKQEPELGALDDMGGGPAVPPSLEAVFVEQNRVPVLARQRRG